MPETTTAEAPEAPAPPRRRPRAAIAVLTTLGLAAVLGAAGAIGWSVLRAPTAKQIETAGEKEIATRWATLPAGEIFPARVKEDIPPRNMSGLFGQTPENKASRGFVQRAGIAPEAACAQAFDPKLADVLTKNGCQTVLRATYIDSTGTLATTIGVAVMGDVRQAGRAEAAVNTAFGSALKESVGLRAVAFPGTAAKDFTDALRQDFWMDVPQAPYLMFRTSGWTLDRGKPDRKVLIEDFSFARFMQSRILDRLSDRTEPCERKRVQC
ncbi:hypothetical protein [Actinomadura hibisca]|uniref:hypothetical protein n=1 Tax=Actinomadura hibisca TaxID=68565 RepID=UPI00082F34F9|nr:hypothetical protein [Actinomadura hibisca]